MEVVKLMEEKILKLILDEPGLSISGITRALGISYPTASYWVAVLSRSNYVQIKAFANSKTAFITSSGQKRLRILLKELKK